MKAFGQNLASSLRLQCDQRHATGFGSGAGVAGTRDGCRRIGCRHCHGPGACGGLAGDSRRSAASRLSDADAVPSGRRRWPPDPWHSTQIAPTASQQDPRPRIAEVRLTANRRAASADRTPRRRSLPPALRRASNSKRSNGAIAIQLRCKSPTTMWKSYLHSSRINREPASCRETR